MTILRFPLVVLMAVLLLMSGVGARADNRYLVTQSTPSDCGPAALATLLRYYLGVPATEKEMERLTGVTLTNGTTLLGLEKAATAKNCAADSFRMTYATLQQQLETYAAPVIVRVLNPQPHFAVVLEAGEQYVFLADPAIGNIVLRKSDFLKRWYIPLDVKPAFAPDEGFVFLAVGPDAEAGRKRRHEMVRRLSQQLEHLKNARPLASLQRR